MKHTQEHALEAQTELSEEALDGVTGGAFAVEREMKESGEKGGTADINIGLGELQR